MEESRCNPICVSHKGAAKCEYHESSFVFKLSAYNFKRGKVYRRPILRFDAFFIVLEGCLNIELNGELLTIKKNEMILLPLFSSLIIHTEEDSIAYIQAFKSGKSHVCVGRKLLFDNVKVKIDKDYKSHILTLGEDLRLFIEVAMKQIGRFKDCNLMYRNKMHELGMYLADNYSADELASFLKPIIRSDYEFVNSINAGIEEFKTVSEVIDSLGMDEDQFYDKFKDIFDCDPHKWLESIRKQVVLQYIIQHKCNASNVIVRFGFSSKDHLDYYCKNNYKEGIDHLIAYYSNYPFKIA